MSSFLRIALPALLVVVAASTVLAQAPRPSTATRVPTAQELATEAEKAYAKRLTLERIDDHYIPSDVLDAMRELDKITSTASQNAYVGQDEDFVVKRLYFSFGRWMGVNWGLYDGSRLSAHLRAMGVDQPDGQIELLMRLYHRHLARKDLDVKQLAEEYKEKKAREEEERLRSATVLDSFRRPEPRPAEGNRPRG